MTTFVNDTFTGTQGQNITAHVGETGASWTLHPSYVGGTGSIDANRARVGVVNAAFYASGVPGTDYYVESIFVAVSGAGPDFGINSRMSTGADTMYHLRYNVGGGTWQLFRTVAGAFTLLGSFIETFNTGTRLVRLDVSTQDASTVRVKCYFAGVLQIDFSDTDPTRITALGRAGWMGRNSPGADGAGMQLDSLVAVDTVGAAPVVVAGTGPARTGDDLMAIRAMLERGDPKAKIEQRKLEKQRSPQVRKILDAQPPISEKWLATMGLRLAAEKERQRKSLEQKEKKFLQTLLDPELESLPKRLLVPKTVPRNNKPKNVVLPKPSIRRIDSTTLALPKPGVRHTKARNLRLPWKKYPS